MKEHSEKDVAERCTRLRKAMGYDYHGGVKAFAEQRLGVSEDRWGNVERGIPVSKQLALIVQKKCPGVYPEWLWFGQTDRLSVQMAQALGELPPTARRGTTTVPFKRRSSSS